MATLQKYLSNFYLLEDIIPLCKWVYGIIKWILLSIWNMSKRIILFLIKSLDDFYFFEDIIPCAKKIISLSKVFFNFIRLKKTELFIFLKYFFKNYQLKKQRSVKEDGINVEKFSSVSRILHETKYGIKNTDYGAVVIDWDLFAEFRNKRTKLKEDITLRRKKLAIATTFSFDTKDRIYHKIKEWNLFGQNKNNNNNNSEERTINKRRIQSTFSYNDYVAKLKEQENNLQPQ